MAQPAQIKTGLPSGEFVVIDNSAASATTTLNAGAPIGFDTPATGSVGAVAQGLNSFGNTGTVLLDSVNDTLPVNWRDATVEDNPINVEAFTYQVLTTVLNDARQGIRVLWKNPAIAIF